ncbi:MAG: DUF4139 domain-containing protein [Sphingomonas sp. SCN 67-18]|uniref:DUF4139 domain-containing protein n=1 Tax=uncultured Sphingomonas sp. TaxID=158754 RepID=UPI00086DB690|nr:DUF4139 domain-containing protein [Sphingomonas sp. SCN 67-18]ODU22213.1 MAG: DUF4139 domain-containing protein [Sphingomonas sp. SCN 67-18]
MRAMIGFGLLALAAPALAQTAQGDVSVTIYNDDLALVQDVRQLDLPAGKSRQEFPDVSARIRPETVTLTAAGAGIVEQNFDYDLLSPSALMDKAVGQTITIVRTNPATGAELREQAKVLAVNGGVVLQIGNRIEVLRDDGLPVRVVFDRLPPNLRARPTLSVTLESARAGARPATLTYLTPGMGWKADYVALFDEAKGKLDVQGWITLTNNTGTSFANARTLLVAGAVQQVQQGPRYGRPTPVQAGTETADRERLGDFYLYPLGARTTIANRQTKQVGFLDVAGAAASKAYEYRNGWLGASDEARSAATVLKFSNAREGGLGDALPAGTVRVYVRDAQGQPQFIGENAIDHTPMGSELGLKTGEAFDVKVKATVEKRERLGERRWRTSMRYQLTNARPGAVTVDLSQAGLDWYFDDTRIVEESLKSERRSSNEAVWHVPVPANGETVVTAVFDTRF